LFNHLLDRISERQISANQLEEFANWLDTQPDVPEGRWFRKFSGMCVCGQGDLVKFNIGRFNDSIRRWTNPPWRTFHSSRRSVGEGGTNP
jgi:hypothetical protein